MESLQACLEDGAVLISETGRFENPDWSFVEIATPDEYTSTARGWVEQKSVQVIGGCCGTGPEHIRALAERLPPRVPSPGPSGRAG